MLRRIFTMLAVFSLAMALGVGSAYAFANGADLDGDGVGDDGYGTHDWIIENAIILAGAEASWVDTTTAVLASDDPDDPETGSSKYLHVFKEFGRGRGAPQAVSDEYYKLMQAYNAGDYKMASHYLGLLSHYYADVCQPFHTRYDKVDRSALHYEYELDINRLTRAKEASPDWLRPRSRQPVPDVRKKAVAAGKFSRSEYNTLVASYSQSHVVTSGDPEMVTGRVLGRAVNDMADIICAVNDGAGLAELPAHIKPGVSKRYPAQNTAVLGSAKVVDASGRPMEGVRVTLVWELNGTPRPVILYTEPDGVARWWQNVGSSPVVKRKTVQTVSHSSGVTMHDSTWYIPSPKLRAGKKGVKTTLSNRTPKRNTVVRAKTKFVSTSGKPVKGLKVTFTWKFKSGTKKTYATTNSFGNAYSKVKIGKVKKGYAVKVKGSAMCGGSIRSSTATLKPK